MKILLKYGRIIDPVLKTDRMADVLVVDGTIEKIGANLSIDALDQTIDLKNKIIAPGFIDMHVHLREPGFEYKETIETGTLSAAQGGFTAVCCMPNTQPCIDDASIVHWIQDRSRRATDGIVDVYPIASVTKNRDGKELSPIMELAEAGAVGFSDDGVTVENAEMMRRALEYASMVNLPIIQHAEESALAVGGVMNEGFVSTALGMQGIPSIAESIMIARDIQIVEYTKSRYHAAHISTDLSVDLIRSAKKRKLNVTCEVTPHHFTLTEDEVRSFDSNMKMNPPLRTKIDIDSIKEGLRDGTIDVIATDHAPHSYDEKQVEFLFAPFGIVGLETAIGLAFTELVRQNIITIYQMIEKFAINPRKILNLPVNNITEGVKANFTFLDPAFEWTVDTGRFKSKSKNSPFHGRILSGKAVGILNNSKVYIAD